MVDPIAGWLLPVLMFSLMFGMGLALTPNDFRRIAQVPGPVIAGTLLQLVAMPSIGFALALLYELPPLLAVGFVVCAACPGGLASNIFVHFGRANTALSLTLTATATMVTLFTLPLWIRAIQDGAGGGAPAIEVPLLATAFELGGLTVLPILVGMAFRNFWPRADRFQRPITAISAIGLFVKLLSDAADRPDPPTELFIASLLPSLWLVAAAGVLGFLVPRLLRQSASDTVTIAVELCLKNVLLGMVVVATSFGVIEPTIPLFAYSSVMLPSALLFVVVYRFRFARRRER